MNRRQKIIVSVVGIFIVLLALVGLTYAYYLTRIQGNTNTTSITVTTADLTLVYGDGSGVIAPTEKLIPGKFSATKTFTVTNAGNDLIEDYVVVFEDVSVTYASSATTLDGKTVTAGQETSFNRPQDLVYSITCVEYTKVDYETNGNNATKISDCNGVEKEQFPNPTKESFVISNDIKDGNIHIYELTMNYLEPKVDQSLDMNKTFSARINIKDMRDVNPYSENINSLAYNVVKNSVFASNGTKFVATPPSKVAETGPTTYWEEGTIKEKGLIPNINNLLSIAAYSSSSIEDLLGNRENSTPLNENTQCSEYEKKYIYSMREDLFYYVSECIDGEPYYEKVLESVLSINSDDYGKSYYYRGAVKDNFVNFAGMCWRIVRIEGDGSTKLILEDKNAECDDTSTNDKNNDNKVYTGNSNIGSANFGYDSETYSGKEIANYLNPKNSYENSMVKSFLDFQTNSISDYLEQLKSGDWCYNDVTYNDTIGTNFINKQEYYKSSKDFYYDSYVRLEGKSPKEPTLKCNGTILTNFDDNKNDVMENNETPMYVSALTADEVAFAGAGRNTGPYDAQVSYLLNTSTGFRTLTLSKKGYNSYPDIDKEQDYVYSLSYIGTLVDFYPNTVYGISDSFNIRPSVILKPNTSIKSGGNGLQTNPYVIES